MKKKNAQNRVEIGHFVYIFVYLICNFLIFKVYCGEKGSKNYHSTRCHEVPKPLVCKHFNFIRDIGE